MFGSQLLMPVGWTEGGSPYGPTWDEVFGDLAWEDAIGEDDAGESQEDERGRNYLEILCVHFTAHSAVICIQKRV